MRGDLRHKLESVLSARDIREQIPESLIIIFQAGSTLSQQNQRYDVERFKTLLGYLNRLVSLHKYKNKRKNRLTL